MLFNFFNDENYLKIRGISYTSHFEVRVISRLNCGKNWEERENGKRGVSFTPLFCPFRCR